MLVVVVVAFVMGLGKYFDKLGRRLKVGLAVFGEIRTCIDLFFFFLFENIIALADNDTADENYKIMLFLQGLNTVMESEKLKIAFQF
jgi:hypothetical protein